MQGLSAAEAAARLVRDGPNRIPAAGRVPLRRRLLAQLRDPLIVVLLIAAALTVATGDHPDAAVILLVIVVNTAVGVAQEVRADRAITALRRLTAPEARVVRDGTQRNVPAEEVVRDDLLVLAEGDVVPADARLLEAAALLVDESSLTGESIPVEKQPGDEVAAGTMVLRGRGRAVTTAVGAANSIGRIAALMAAGPAPTPLQRRLARLGRTLAIFAAALSALIAVLGLLRGESAELMAVTAISLVVAAVPESLPAVITLSLALGARRRAARNALVRRLPAVETLGSMTVLATDKTGTLTEGSMVVRRLWTPAGELSVSGSGYAPVGTIRAANGSRAGRRTAGPVAAGPVPADPAAAAGPLLQALVLCNDAALRPPPDGAPDGWTAVGDPTEAALLAAGGKLGLDRLALEDELPRIAELPFDSGRQRMTTVHRLPGDRVRVICKGAPEVLLRRPRLRAADPALGEARAVAGRWAAQGLRVLAVAGADREPWPDRATGSAVTAGEPAGPGPEPAGPGPEQVERGLTLLGLAGIVDPPRSAAVGTIADCRRAGVTPVLITGDHPATARAIATELGVIRPGEAVLDCAAPTAEAGPVALDRVRVFARATPERKLDIIRDLQAAGHIVAMTGDGVNDGPALRRADIGVAMGRRGTEVARQAADLVLADDELSTVVAAVEEGRRVYANIRRFLLYGLSGGTAEIAVMLAGPFLGLPLPLLPAQILWINLLTHGLPGVALGSEPAEPRAMHRPPRPPAESVLGGGLWQRIPRVAVVIAAVTLAVAVWGQASGRAWQSMAFLALGCTQLSVALGCRARPGTLRNPALLAAVAAALLLQLAGLFLPPLRDLLDTRPLPAADLLVVVALSTLGYVAVKLDRRIHHDPLPGT